VGRGVAVLLLLVSVIRADPDGAIAEPTRWTGPHGPASNSRRSRALAVTRDVVEAWATKLPGTSVAPPVTWDGRIYALCEASKGHILCVLDLGDGKLIAKKRLPKAPRGDLHTWGRNVFVRTSENQISTFRLAGRSLIPGWKYAGARMDSVRVLENEIYVRSGGSIHRLSPQSSKPLWTTTGDYSGPLALYGNSVFCQIRGARDVVKITVLRRSGGQLGTTRLVAWTQGASRTAAELMIAPTQIVVSPGLPFATKDGSATHAFIPFTYTAQGPVLGKCNGLSSFGTWPAACRDGVLTMEEDRRWMWWTKKGGRVLAKRRWTPDLFTDKVAPTVLGDVAYFGTWAADIVTGEVLWRLPVRAVLHPPVPADKLVVIIDSQSHMRAYRER